LAAYQGDAFTNISLLESSYTAFGEPGNLQYALRSRIRFEVVSGLTYYIAADSWSEVGFDLQATFTSAPGNDAFDSRYLLKPAGVSASGSNVGATLQPGESASGSRSVWWSWTPDSSAPVFLTTFGSTFDTALSIFTGTSFGSLSLVAFNDNASALASPDGSPLDTSSRIKFFPNAGTPYQISVSGQSDESGRVALNFTKVGIEDFTINQRNLQADNSANFNVTLHLTNLRTNATGPLRIRLLARAAYDCITYLKSDLDFLDSLNVPDEEIGTVDLPLPATIGAGASTDVSVSGVCPPPSVYYGGIYYGWGYARSIIAILEELAGSAWQSQDARPFLVGAWPDVQNFQGTGGGVITVSSGLGSSASNPGILDVRLGPPAAIRMGGAWRVSPTNYGELAELRFYTNYIASSRKLAVQSTNFSLELREMPGFVKPANQAVQIVPGNVSVLDLSYSVTPPRLNFSRAAGLSIVGTTGTAYRVEITPQLQASNSWSPVTNVTLGSGTNSVPGTAPSPGTNRFYRTVWLTD
jgi:hypothetical protein